jgi:prevent-host-death family protein
MSAQPEQHRTAGVRELRRNFRRYLAQVKAGERLVVTRRGRPVAVFLPLPAEGLMDQREDRQEQP